MKIAIESDDMRKLVIKAHYADVNVARAVYNRDCEIMGIIHYAVKSVYDALDEYDEQEDCLKERHLNPSVGDMLFYTVVDLMEKLEKAGLAKRD